MTDPDTDPASNERPASLADALRASLVTARAARDPDAAEMAARGEAWRIWAEDDNESPDVEVFRAGWDCASAYFDARVAEARAAERQRILQHRRGMQTDPADGSWVYLIPADLLDGAS